MLDLNSTRLVTLNKSSGREIKNLSSFAKIKSKLEESAEDSRDQEALPCENPILKSWVVAVFGSETDSTGKVSFHIRLPIKWNFQIYHLL